MRSPVSMLRYLPPNGRSYRQPVLWLFVTILLTFGTTGATSAQPPSIFWSPDLNRNDCSAEIAIGAQRTLYILESGNDGIQGFEFRTTGLPDPYPLGGFIWSVSVNPAAAVFLGDPMGAGCIVAFPDCQEGSVKTLFSVQMFNLADSESYDLQAGARTVPSNPFFDCPLVVLCDAPVFTKQCVQTAPLYLNGETASIPSGPTPAEGAINVPLNTTLTVENYGESPSCVLGIPSWHLYFGTSADPPKVACTELVFCPLLPVFTDPYDPGPLQPNTTYYWKVEHCPVTGGCRSSDVWSFTTGTIVSTTSTGWTDVKRRFR